MPDGLLDALLAGTPDGLVLCDGMLRPVRSSAAAVGVAVETGEGRNGLAWSRTALGEGCREAAALALDRGGVAALGADDEGRTWEVRAAPMEHERVRVCVSLRAAGGGEREEVLRAAHDLKAPLHAIVGFATLLRREHLGPLVGAQRAAVETMAGEAERLQEALGALVERARTGGCASDRRDGVAVVGADWGEVANAVTARFAALAEASGVTLQVDEAITGVTTTVSERDAATILENLVANALAARPRWVRVALADSEAQRGGGWVALLVEDDGPGIPEELLERIFAPRVRIEDRGAPGGCGLGLTIARELAVRAGGTLTAARRAGGGAAFTLRVPEVRPDAAGVLRLAPVTTHAALARAQMVLEEEYGAWRMERWAEGVLSVEVRRGDTRSVVAAAGRAGLVCW